ncbi:hypothetical protein HU200_043442 [Digitaria exilis]|uniref:Elongation factor-like 1 n=1 Tax=Digitaria exilis TaxID=1010633 RepID=A0A835B5S7_9POAL|nr:hypothetical protein HU200_043442 [Digitaria exilis]
MPAAASSSSAAVDDPHLVRNTCILAHVDHGKTSLADHLVASGGGGLLHPKLAGSARFMDHLPEEQRRAITMKSSSVALRYAHPSTGGPHHYRVHLIDSPGHADFCSEVSAAARLSDSALVVVDAAKGVRVQTHAALRQAFVERLRPCLVLNKLDRLITDLLLSPDDAYARLRRILAEVNSFCSALRSGSYFSSLLHDDDGRRDGDDEDEDAFHPHKGNVVFACARDGWGFRIDRFADLYAKKTGASKANLLRGFWGPYYVDKEKKAVLPLRKESTGSAGAEQQPAFVQNVLKPLWKVYQRGLTPNSGEWMQRNVVSVFDLKVSPRELHSKDPKVSLHAVLRAWLPLADSVMEMLVECTPDPVAAQAFRVPRLMPERRVVADSDSGCASIVAEAERVRSCVAACSTSTTAPVVVFVSKMFVVPYTMLPSKGLNGELLNHNHQAQHSEQEPEESFLAFARVFSGVLRAGQKVFVLSPLYDPVKGDAAASGNKHAQEVELQCLYQMLGQDLMPIDSVAAGNVVAIQGLGQHVLKSATLSSTKNCWPFSSMTFQVSPMLKVAVEPSKPTDLGALVKGLKLLNQADPLVVYTVSQRGEHVLAAAGQVHLERCIKDLQDRFAKVQLEVSKPLVSFRETIQGEDVGMMGSMKVEQRFAERSTPNGRFTVRVQVSRLPSALTKVLAESEELLGQIIEGGCSQFPHDGDDSTATLRHRLIGAVDSELEEISEQVEKEKLDRYSKTLLGYLQRIMALGPSHVGPNFLLLPDLKSSFGVTTRQNGRKGILVSSRCHISERLGFVTASDAESKIITESSERKTSTDSLDYEALRNSVVSGFQFATNAGPICDEPMRGLAFIVEPYIFADSSDVITYSDDSIFTGQVINAVKEACREAVLLSKPRLVEPMYFCELTTPTEQLGAAFAVLGDCQAKVLKEEMQEGTSLFTVHSHLPVYESSEFPEKLRKLTAGAASAILAFSHWEVIPQDPFFTPKTQEEIEEFGDGASIGPNLAKKLMNSVRRRKGLHVEEKIVQHGTKQRTLAKKV